MEIDQVIFYKQRYQGSKVAFNSRKGVGQKIVGIATQVVPEYNIAIIRDDDNFPHCVSLLTLKEV